MKFYKKLNKKVKKVSCQVFTLKGQLIDCFFIKIQKFLNIFKKKRPNYFIVCGFSESDKLHFVKMMKEIFKDDKDYLFFSEVSALETTRILNKDIISNSEIDIINFEKISSLFGSSRCLKIIFLVRDPRDLISSFHPSAPGQFFQGYDYCLFLKDNIKSYTNPGILTIYNSIKSIENSNVNIIKIKNENLNQSLEKEIKKLVNFINFDFSCGRERFDEIFSGLDIPEEKFEKQKIFSDSPSWVKDERLIRVFRQIELCSDIEKIACTLGYPSLDEILEKYGITISSLTINYGTIVLFHTDDDLYKHEANRCIKYIEKLGLKYDVTVIPKKSQWVENCAMKSKILLDARKRLRGPILYVDVDAVIHKDPWPYLSQYEGDFGVYFHSNGELMSGTILINDTQKAMGLLQEWVASQDSSPLEWDQKVLEELISSYEKNDNSGTGKINIQRLPPSFCYVFDKLYSSFHGEIFIEHLQASRQVKRPLGSGSVRRENRILEIHENAGSDGS